MGIDQHPFIEVEIAFTLAGGFNLHAAGFLLDFDQRQDAGHGHALVVDALVAQIEADEDGGGQGADFKWFFQVVEDLLLIHALAEPGFAVVGHDDAGRAGVFLGDVGQQFKAVQLGGVDVGDENGDFVLAQHLDGRLAVRGGHDLELMHFIQAFLEGCHEIRVAVDDKNFIHKPFLSVGPRARRLARCALGCGVRFLSAGGPGYLAGATGWLPAHGGLRCVIH